MWFCTGNCQRVRSLWQREVQRILMRTSWAFGGATITSSISNGFPASLATAAAPFHLSVTHSTLRFVIDHNNRSKRERESVLPLHRMGLPVDIFFGGGVILLQKCCLAYKVVERWMGLVKGPQKLIVSWYICISRPYLNLLWLYCLLLMAFNSIHCLLVVNESKLELEGLFKHNWLLG